MKPNSPGLLVVSLLVLVAAAVGIWSWSAAGPTLPDAPDAPGGRPGVHSPSPTEAGAEVEGSEGNAGETQRTEVPIEPAAGAEATDEPVAEHRVRGRVVDLRGAGIEGAWVGVADRSVENLPIAIGGIDDLVARAKDGVATDADGYFDVPLEASGKFRLLATHAEYPRGEYRGSATADVEGVVIQLRDGARIAGRVMGVPAGVAKIEVFSRRVQGAVEGAASGMFIDLGGLVEGIGVPFGRSATVAEDRTFELRGLDPDERYTVWAANADAPDRLPVKSTYAQDLRAGTLGVELIWREPLTVTVRVVDAATSQPIEQLDVAAGFVKEIKMLGMTVPVPTTRALHQKEFPDGIVRIDGLEVIDKDNDVFAIEVRADGRRAWKRHDVAVPRSGNVDLGIVSLETSAVVVARVVAAKTGEPIAGAGVELIEVVDEVAEDGAESGGGSISFSTQVSSSTDGGPSPSEMMLANANRQRMLGTTDENGECRITAEFDGEAELKVQAEGYARSAAGPFTVSSRGEIEIDVSMYRGGKVQVTTVDGHGAPAPLVFVKRTGPVDGDEKTLRTDKNGLLTFEALSIGEHTFKLLDVDPGKSGPLKVGLTGILDASAGKPVQVVDGETVNVTLAQPLYGNVTGFVTIDGAPLDAASVRVFRAGAAEQELAAEMFGSLLGGLIDTGSAAETDVDGLFEMERIEVGDYRLVVNHKDLIMPSSMPIQVVEGDNRVDFPLVVSTLRGRVVDTTGAPVARATVTVVPAEGKLTDLTDQMGDAKEMMAEIFGGGSSGVGVRTERDGTFELRGVRTGIPLSVVAKARMHVDSSQRVGPITAGATRDGVQVVLQPGSRIRVSAVGVRGAMSAKLEWAGAPSDDAPRDREGLLRRSRVTIDGLVPGRWSVALSGTGLPADLQPRTIEVAAGETERVDFGK